MADQPFQTRRLVTVFGGSGFVGRHLVRRLVKRGWRVRVAVRRPDLAQFLQPQGVVGQIAAVQANLRDPASVQAAVEGADAVVNLAAILSERGRQTFEAVHAFGAAAIGKACAAAAISDLVHVSAIGADAGSASSYARSKAAGEASVRAAVPGAVVMRPSVIFGPEDEFFNRFATLARALPVLPVPGAATRLQPVFVGDVAEAIARALEGGAKAGATYELGGPATMTMREVYAFTLKTIGRKRVLVDLPDGPARLVAGATEIADALTLGLMPRALATTRDQMLLLKTDNVVSADAARDGRDLAGLGIAAEGCEAIVPTYLYRFRKTGQYERGFA
ncbi:MAG: complex I NDUFA9 subunit family protein [Hyphomicrobiales bacterium]|nr:complex I NDUFA9 subunit family protein [Hyphomicrobiales bacterium]